MTAPVRKYRKNTAVLPAILLAGLIISPLLGSMASVPGIPIWYQDTFLYSCLILSIIGGITAVGLFTGTTNLLRPNLMDYGVFALMGFMLIRTGMMDFTPQSSWAQIFFLSGGYFVARVLWMAIDHRHFHRLLGFVLVIGILEAMYGLAQLYGWLPSNHSLFTFTGTFPNPGPYSGWLACLFPIAIYGVLQKNSSPNTKYFQSISWIFLILASLVLIPATSRAAILGAGLGSVVMAWPKIKTWQIWNRTWVKMALGLGIMIGALILYLVKKDSADGRLLIYKVTAAMISEEPLLGWGWDGFAKMYNNFQSEYFKLGLGSEREKYLADNVIYGFNEPLKFTAEMGILGLILLLGIMIPFLWKWRQQVRTVKPRPLHYLGMGIITAWGIFSCFSYPLSIPALAIILPVTLAGLNTRIIQREDTGQRVNSQTRTTAKNSVRVFYPLFISFLTGFMAYWFIYSKPIATKWIQANLYQSQKNYEPAINLYRELYPNLENEGWFLQFAGKSLSLNQQYNESTEILERALNFSSDPAIFTTLGQDYTIHGIDEDPTIAARAEWLLTHVKYMSPYKYYPRYLLAQHFYHTGQVEKAIAEAEQLLNIVPKVVSPATNDIRKTMKRLVDSKIFQPEKTAIPVNFE